MKTSITMKRHQETVHSDKMFLIGIFGWMGAGLTVTALISYMIYISPALMNTLITEGGITALGYVVMFCPIAFVLLMTMGFSRFSYTTLVVLFMLYAAMMGASLSFVFLIFTNESIHSTFFIAAIMFSIMGIIGYTTKADLTNIGSILLMALIGMVVASMLNLFLQKDSLSYVISFIGVIVFSGLTAWDIQKLKKLSVTTFDTDTKSKFGILGAFTLYLDFINLFLSLLNLFGKRKK